ncbi:MAG: protein kinase domain-containing protein [Candidatus Eiseniibacteriota bacterium]
MPERDGLTAALEGQYRILAEAGQGANATVYEADDLKHGRRVALKVLHPDVAQAVGRDRFLREIELAASLQHPHILPLYDSGAAGSFLYYVTPMVEGGSLRDRLTKQSELPLDEALRIAAEVADGLDFAHRRSVIHRDIKPENILLSSGHALVADFGIARALAGEAAVALTATGFAVGTPAYMSPEQASGSARVDGRTDLYSLGCVLFEMLAGRPPFVATSSEAVVRQHLTASPPDLRPLRPAVGDAVATLVTRLLTKDPIDRPAHAAEVRDALEQARHEIALGAKPAVATPGGRGAQTGPGSPRLPRRVAIAGGVLLLLVVIGGIALRPRAPGGCVPSASSIRSLAVLPFENQSGDPTQAYFASGMTEELIGNLATIASLRVISRTSSMTYKDARKPVPVIARELGVDAVVEGSAARSGDRVRVRIELIQARPEQSIWSQSFDRPFGDVLTLQAELAETIAREVRARLTHDERTRLAAAPDVRPEAHEAYLRGRFALSRPGLDGYRTAMDEFKSALKADATDARSWVGVANTYYYMSNVYLPPNEAMPPSRAAAERALALDSTLAEAHSALAVVLAQYDWKWREAEARYRRAIELSPSDAGTRIFYATMLCLLGRLDDARREFEQARALDPLSFYIPTIWVQPDYLSGDYQRVLDRTIALARTDSTFGPTYVLMGLCHLNMGRPAEAVADLERGAQRVDNTYAWGVLGHAYGRAGREADARRVLESLKARARREHVSGYSVAIVYLGLGDRDRAFDWLERSFRNRDEDLVALAQDPLLAPLRGDPRFRSLIQRIDLPG